jgi:flagellar basal body-associated protein FliL
MVKQNIAIFLVVFILFIVIAVVGYLIFVLQGRMAIGRSRGGETDSEVSSVPP